MIHYVYYSLWRHKINNIIKSAANTVQLRYQGLSGREPGWFRVAKCEFSVSVTNTSCLCTQRVMYTVDGDFSTFEAPPMVWCHNSHRNTYSRGNLHPFRTSLTSPFHAKKVRNQWIQYNQPPQPPSHSLPPKQARTWWLMKGGQVPLTRSKGTAVNTLEPSAAGPTF